MKKHIKLLFTYLLLLTFLLPVKVNARTFSLQTNDQLVENKDIAIALDSKNDSELPKNFRILEDLNISGSAQFTPTQLKNIKNKINKPNIYIIDLRQESHGFVNDNSINFYTKDKEKYGVINKDLNSQQTLEAEKKDLETIKMGSTLNIYSKKGKVKDSFHVEKVSSEADITKENNVNYKRFAIRDGHTPENETIDEFVEFINSTPKDAHFHFHCKHGKGRTTTFMALFQIMTNNKNLSLDDILNNQLDTGGIDLNEKISRKKLLESFYKYIQDNKSNNYSVSFSKWVSNY